jgi:hypothetical protein
MRLAAILLGVWAAWSSPAFADEQTERKIAESALREARAIISSDLFGHYDVTELAVVKTEDLRGRVAPQRDYGLVRTILKFSATRNATRSSSLSPGVYEAGRCTDWLYLHCGVPTGHVFDGKLEVLLAVDQAGAWRAVSPHWRSRRQYALDGFLLLDGRQKEGYVLAPKPR